jgi:hypothetical protein
MANFILQFWSVCSFFFFLHYYTGLVFPVLWWTDIRLPFTWSSEESISLSSLSVMLVPDEFLLFIGLGKFHNIYGLLKNFIMSKYWNFLNACFSAYQCPSFTVNLVGESRPGLKTYVWFFSTVIGDYCGFALKIYKGKLLPSHQTDTQSMHCSSEGSFSHWLRPSLCVTDFHIVYLRS